MDTAARPQNLRAYSLFFKYTEVGVISRVKQINVYSDWGTEPVDDGHLD